MPFEPIARRTVSEDAYDQILDGMLSGDLAAGQTLPSERELSRLLGVSRPAVREALTRVAAAGLITVRHGEGTRIRDLATAGGLDLLPRLLVRDGSVVPDVARSVVEARAEIGPVVAGLAARRATDEDVERIRATVDGLTAELDPIAQQVAALEFWSRIIDGAHSIAFRLMYNSLRAAYEPALDALAAVLEPEVGNAAGYRAVLDAVADHDPDSARVAAGDLLQPATTTLLGLFDAMTATEPQPEPQPGPE
ncbi:FadR/GntR family transcriptional regulator [Gordonia soli]|uniref:Putative GntR family transcriptional regulator n=1 Tax=Gordonia soli NBRC 108243 TaxID=1223545 RepID=M0QER9_9ACTN|nr:FadR/GntR family transcriptional regulator [Gordonia soli]GAC67098.1 putative GntR family transcriptional regulator [Gordonia soli NBRC 108243]